MSNNSGLVINQVKERLLFLAPSVQTKSEREACSNDFEVIQLLGQGAFGKVFKVRNKKTKTVYALKQISKKQIKQQKMTHQILNEVKIMYLLNHANIIKLYSHYEEEDYIYLVLECATGGQLWHKLNKIGRFDEKTVKQFMIEIMSAIEFLHTRNPPIIHRDIKPENILLDADGHIKIADFGWSNVNNHQRTTYCGTLDYLAPEMIMEVGHDEKIDLWSLGVLIYELLTGKAPFAPSSNIKDQKEQQKALEENILKVRINYPADFPTIAKSLVQGLLQKDPAKRFGIKQMREHPWFANCEMPKSITVEEQKPKGENARPPVKDNTAQFTRDELAQIESKYQEYQEPAAPSEKDQIVVEEDPKSQEQDLSKNTVAILNKKISELSKQLNEAEIKLSLKVDENKALQQQLNEKQQSQVQLGVDQRRLLLLEEERNKLKKDFETLWDEQRMKDAEILRLQNEQQKLQQLQKQVEKLKQDKSQYQEKIQKLQEILNQKEQELIEAKKDTDVLNLSISRQRMPSNAGSFATNGDELQDLNSTFAEMRNKFQIAKEQIEEFDKAQRRIIQQEAEIISLTSQLNQFKDSIRVEIQEQFDDKLEDIERKLKEEKQRAEMEHLKQIQQMESEKQLLKEQICQLEMCKIQNEGLKDEIQRLDSILQDLKIQNDMDKKLRLQNEQRLREQEVLILDYREKEKVYSKRQ